MLKLWLADLTQERMVVHLFHPQTAPSSHEISMNQKEQKTLFFFSVSHNRFLHLFSGWWHFKWHFRNADQSNLGRIFFQIFQWKMEIMCHKPWGGMGMIFQNHSRTESCRKKKKKMKNYFSLLCCKNNESIIMNKMSNFFSSVTC